MGHSMIPMKRRMHLPRRRRKSQLLRNLMMMTNDPLDFSTLMTYVYITLVMLILQCDFKFSLSGPIPLWVWLPVPCTEGCWNLSRLASGAAKLLPLLPLGMRWHHHDAIPVSMPCDCR